MKSALYRCVWLFSAPYLPDLTIDGVEVPVTYAGLQPTFNGLDQINALLLRTLAGKGEVDLKVTVDGKVANTTRVAIK